VRVTTLFLEELLDQENSALNKIQTNADFSLESDLIMHNELNRVFRNCFSPPPTHHPFSTTDVNIGVLLGEHWK
jgi:hypothetical protein